MPTPRADVDHLLRRVGFGGLSHEITALSSLSWGEIVDQVTDPGPTPPLGVLPNLDPTRDWGARWLDMVRYWLDRCRTSPFPLAEKMVLFWHGHLCSALDKVSDHRLMFDQNQLFRSHGLGGLGPLVQAASIQPAMLLYLDNAVNTSFSPNENFGRELKELFLLGVGNYTEDDVRAAARAWTGHGLNEVGDSYVYAFHSAEHDYGTKTFMGVTRNWNGPEIIDHLLTVEPHRTRVARFIAGKLWAFLAYPGPDAGVVEAVATTFRDSNFNITALVRAILLHPEFRSARARNALVRSPIEFVVAAARHSGLPMAEANLWTLRNMGQQPYDPPNVAGWGRNGYWISAPALWAKQAFASQVRWRLESNENGLLHNSRQLSPEAAVDAALTQFGIESPSVVTRNALVDYVRGVRERDTSTYGWIGWSERAGLLYLPMLTPEFQLA